MFGKGDKQLFLATRIVPPAKLAGLPEMEVRSPIKLNHIVINEATSSPLLTKERERYPSHLITMQKERPWLYDCVNLLRNGPQCGKAIKRKGCFATSLGTLSSVPQRKDCFSYG